MASAFATAASTKLSATEFAPELKLLVALKDFKENSLLALLFRILAERLTPLEKSCNFCLDTIIASLTPSSALILS